jgi:hypothetical protein
MLISNVAIITLVNLYLLFKMKDCESFVKILFEFDLYFKFFNNQFFLIF